MPSPKPLRELSFLATKKGRAKRKSFLVEGVRALQELARSDWPVKNIFVQANWEKDVSLAALVAAFRARKIPLYPLTRRELEKITQTETPPGIAAEVAFRRFGLNDLLSRSPRLLVALDGIRDPGNLGTIIRTADAFGAGGLLLSEDTAEFYSPKVVRATAGSLFHLPIAVDLDLPPAFIRLKQAGYLIAVTHRQSSETAAQLSPTGRVCLVLGSEAFGVRKEIASLANHHLSIPITPHVDSLNVAVAAGILLYLLSNRNISP